MDINQRDTLIPRLANPYSLSFTFLKTILLLLRVMFLSSPKYYAWCSRYSKLFSLRML
jgi:hypothetical protein